MFDASFLELVIVGVVALLVLGPEKLPGAVKTAGLWIGRLRRSFNNIKRDIEKEIGADDIRRQLRNEAIMEKFDSTKKQFTKTVDSIKKETNSIKDDMSFEKEISGFMGETKSETDKNSKPSESTNEAVEQLVNTPPPKPDTQTSNQNDTTHQQSDDSPAKQEENK